MQIHPANYITEVFIAITESEGSREDPYFDLVNKATIGYGVNIEVSGYLRIVLQNLGLFDGKTNAEIAAIQQTFTDTINATPDGVNSTLLSNLNTAAQQYGLTSFALNETQSTAAFYAILSGVTIGGQLIEGKEAKLDRILNNSLPHDSLEYVAVMSMFYNAESLVPAGGGTATAIINGDRPEAWRQIRYVHADQLWSRRYSEATLFSLTDNAAMSEDEARAIYRMYTEHGDTMVTLDQEHGGLGSLTTSLQPAANFLISQYGEGKTISPLNIWVTDEAGGTITRAGKPRANEANLLIGDIGADTLTGGAAMMS